MSAPPGLLIYSKPLKNRAVFHTLLTEGLHIQQRPDLRLVAGADFGGGAINDNPENGAKELFARMTRAFPTLDLQYDGHTLGLRPTPKDGFPVIGRPAKQERLYITAMHSGATLAPITAKLAAKEILTGARDPFPIVLHMRIKHLRNRPILWMRDHEPLKRTSTIRHARNRKHAIWPIDYGRKCTIKGHPTVFRHGQLPV